jgi:hypothetical protein
VEKAQAVSVLNSLCCERVVPGARVALLRAGNVGSDDTGRRQRDHDVCGGETILAPKSFLPAEARKD